MAEQLWHPEHEAQPELAAALGRVTQLEQAVLSNRRIGMAIGILMASLKITEDQAFDLLRTASSRRNEKLRDIAEEVLLTGELGTVPSGV
ncbi:ANTAR domain-containing protein [Blastococcus saxobsidens]|uniref:Response regulator receiver and ANTAR domain protein n=1 Tax=Blastococcus saxobsidens (strain DD2) TaxID=1146883 RepID=H6RN84_BLASD|nr:ANTAR domain-containing protein [Blastococcus saxobsidens]CCG02632.1 Response regulator receiver and ANTAR domain protein [Blastococcus saxobsidens DD2]